MTAHNAGPDWKLIEAMAFFVAVVATVDGMIWWLCGWLFALPLTIIAGIMLAAALDISVREIRG